MADEQKPYHRVERTDADRWDECYDVLVGPDGFKCMLTEPEDRNWWRDGQPAVDRLNSQHAEINRLRTALERFSSAADSLCRFSREVLGDNEYGCMRLVDLGALRAAALAAKQETDEEPQIIGRCLECDQFVYDYEEYVRDHGEVWHSDCCTAAEASLAERDQVADAGKMVEGEK